MKKYLTLIICLLVFPSTILASEKIDVTLNKCVDGDTAWFNINDETIKARFLAIDTPESTTTIEEYGKEASEFTCNLLTNASKIQIEYDDDSDEEDKYNRKLVWVFVDDELLQELVVKEGLAEVKYIYGDYKYLDEVNEALEYAKKNKLNMWSDYEQDYTDYIVVAVGVGVVLISCIFSKKSRNKYLRTAKTKS